ncbi:MAG: DUF1080 domain-containing protein [Gemmatimonadota bacterium]
MRRLAARPVPNPRFRPGVPVLLLLTVACATSPTVHNALSADEREGGWILLFDGATLDGWRSYYSESPPPGWRVEAGTLHRFDGGGDIVTLDEFANFELSLEWRVADAGNSGIFYLAALGSDNIFMSAPEMQVLDDARHPDGRDPLTSAGANYGLYPAPRGVVKAAGVWNHARIVVQDGRVEHWLNGEKVVEYTLGGPEWTELVKNSKFNDWPEYGTARSGHIGLQDHGDPVWYRNIKLRVIG